MLHYKTPTLFKYGSIILLAGGLALTGCETTKSKKSVGRDNLADGSRDGGDRKGSKAAAEKEENEAVFVAGSTRTIAFSATNNSLTSKTVDKGKARSLAENLENGLKNPDFKDRASLVGLMSLKRFGDAPLEDVYKAAQKLISVEMKKDIRREMSEVATLELALTALRSGKLTLAEHFLGNLSDNKNKNIIAAVKTAEGMIAQMDDRLPEAVALWEEALKAIPGYQPAALNIGFTALRFGDYKTALKMLEPMSNDWFALYGVLVAERLSGNAKRVSALCSRINSMKGDYKPALLSCALNEYQGLGNYAEAKKMLNKLVKAKGGSPVVDERAYRMIAAIDDDERKSKEEASRKKEEAIRKQEAAKEAKAAAREAKESAKDQSKQPTGGSGDGAAKPEPQGKQPAESGDTQPQGGAGG